MIRDMGNRIVAATDDRITTRDRARTQQTGFRPRRHTASLWPRFVWACCTSCRRSYRCAPRGGTHQSAHDPYYCAAQRDREARES